MGAVSIFVPHAGCPHQCSFCNQRSISGAQSVPSPAEVSALLEDALPKAQDPAHTEIAFFGGSFTAIPRREMLALLEAADPFIGGEGFCGVRISTRPDAIDRDVLEILREHHVTAIELGAQCMDDAVLLANRRGHTVRDVEDASRLIRAGGFSLGLQMMLGLYGDTPEGARHTAEAFAALEPDTVRVYPTLVLRGTSLAGLYERGLYRPMELEQAVELGAELLLYFRERGIRVIRMGLHASRELESQLLAGPYHPAYRELCQSRIYQRLARAELAGRMPAGGRAELRVAPGALSQMIGWRRSNLEALALAGWDAAVREEPGMPPYQVHVVPEEGSPDENSCF